MTPQNDVLIIGAGLSGLVGARRLQAAGLDVAVLEARMRLGGRMVSTGTAAGCRVDLGGQWGGASHHRFAGLLQELGLTRYPSHYDGLGVFHWQGQRRLAPLAERFEDSLLFFEPEALQLPGAELAATRRLQSELAQLVARIDRHRPWLTPGAERLDRLSVAAWAAEHSDLPLSRLPLDWLCRVGGSGGFEPWESSILHLAWTQAVAPQAETPEAWLVHGGAGSVAVQLAADLQAQAPDSLQLGQTVVRIVQDAAGVSVHCDDGSRWQARLAIVAVPPPQRLAIRFDPPLPAAHRALLMRMPMGSMTKVLAVYEQPFWREEGWNGLAIGDLPALELTADSGPPEGGAGVLAGFVAGERAIRLGGLPAARRQRLILEDLERCWGPRAAAPLALVEQDWNGEPCSGGAFTSFLTPGTWTGPMRVAAGETGGPAPADHGRVLWAGTEVSPRWPGYFEGAIEAAEQAATRAIALLQG